MPTIQAHLQQNAKAEVNVSALLTEARSWLDTPYHHQGRLKGVGVDCIGLIIGVAHALNLSEFDTHDYARIPNANMLESLLAEHMHSIAIRDQMPGDIGLFTFDREPQHVAFFTEIGILHSYAHVNKCVEHGFNAPWPKRLVAVFRLKGVAPWPL